MMNGAAEASLTYEPLNPRQRLGLLLIDEVPDRVVVYPLITAHAAVVAGMSVRRCVTDGKALAQAQLQALRRYRHDAASVFSDVALIAEALGSRLAFADDDVPVLEQPVLDAADAWENIRPTAKGDLPGRYAVYLEAITQLQREIGGDVPIMAFIPAPFTTAALLRGPEDFLVDCLLDSTSCHRLLDLSLQEGIRLTDLCIEAGAIPMLVDPLASASVISPAFFSDFALPYLRRFSDHLHRSDFDVFLHICGRSEPILGGIAASGCDLFSCDHVPLAAACDRIGSAVRLIGNLNPTDLLECRPEIIRNRVGTILDSARLNPKGFILSTGCEVPIAAPTENVQAFVDAGRRAGLYWGEPL